MGLAWSQRVGSIALVAMAACSAACSGGGSQPGETTDSTGGRIAAASSAGPLQFGVVGSPIDLSANVSEAILPGGTIFQDSAPLFGTSPDPKQSAELLHLSSAGVNPSSRSTVSGAFASSLAESDGNGGVGASQVIFGPPGGTDPSSIRQLVAQSLWTQTFVYNGTPAVSIRLHIVIPPLQVELWGIPPNRTNPSSTETAQVSARVDTVITHPDGTFSKGGSFELGLREFETQIPDGVGGLLNFADVEPIGSVPVSLVQEDFDFSQTRVRWRLDTVYVTDLDLGVLHTGDTLAYVYTLTAQGTTHGFERGYDAFLGDPFGVDVVAGNLSVAVSLVTEAPAITSAAGGTITAGTGGTFTVTATGTPPPTLAETAALPGGVSFDGATGVLNVGPSTAPGTYLLVFTAANGVLPDASQAFTLTVSPSLGAGCDAEDEGNDDDCRRREDCRPDDALRGRRHDRKDDDSCEHRAITPSSAPGRLGSHRSRRRGA